MVAAAPLSSGDRAHRIVMLALAAVLVCVVLLGLQRPGYVTTNTRRVQVHLNKEVCSQEDPVALYASLYHHYRDGLLAARELAAKFCANTSVKPSSAPHYHHCLTGILESEVLYLRLRCLKPSVVAEVSSALGYSTLWILAALDHNEHGVLHSFDMFDTQFPFVLNDNVRKRWTFHKGDMAAMFPQVLAAYGLDYLHIDTCHDDACVKMYLKKIVGAVATTVTDERPVFVSAHDMYDTFYSFPTNMPVPGSKAPLSEGVLLLQWLAFSGAARHMHTLSAGVSTIGTDIQAVRHEVLRDAASMQYDTWANWKGKDFTSSVYFELLSLDNMCKNCLPID